MKTEIGRKMFNEQNDGNDNILTSVFDDLSIEDQQLLESNPIDHQTIFVPYATGQKESELYKEVYLYIAEHLGAHSSLRYVENENKI